MSKKAAIITPSVEETVSDLQNDGCAEAYDKLLAIIFDRVLFSTDEFSSQTFDTVEILRLLTTLRESIYSIANPYATLENYYVRAVSDS